MENLRASFTFRRFSGLLVAGILILGARLQGASGTRGPLTDYVGTYSADPGKPVEIVAGDELFAVLNGAKYRLKFAGPDEFINAVGGRIPFRRDSSGVITGYVEEGRFHPRISQEVSADSAALAFPRPRHGENAPTYTYSTPKDLGDGIPVGSIDTELGDGTPKAIVDRILDGTYRDVDSVLLFHHGRLQMEEYFYGYTVERTHQMRSATKSVVSALIGIAIDQHALSGVEEAVIPHMGYATLGNPDPRKMRITVGDFLSMTSGLECDDHDSKSVGREEAIYEKPDWVKATLDLPMIHDPGTDGSYCSGGVAVLGRLTEKVSGLPLADFAQKNLFGPLGISRENWSWNYDLTSADTEYAQIHLRPRDCLKLGILFADDGRWHGKQVISSAWAKTSLAEHSQVENTSYGYFWWRPWLGVKTKAGIEHVHMVAAQGNGGQKIYLLPQFDLVAVFTAGDYNSNGAPPNRIMADLILPALIAARDRVSGTAPPAN
jgi:CubicO group peptidase (beta-lactamase class C family)